MQKRAKGIIAKPMPESWYNRRANSIKLDDDEETIAKKNFDRVIVADKKPYFMTYVYPHLKREYDSFYKNADFKAHSLFGKHINELYSSKNLTDEEQTFIDYYNTLLPVGMNPCVVNRISWLFEKTFNGYLKEINSASKFDYGILKSDTEYSHKNYSDIKKLYKEYLNKVEDFRKRSTTERIEDPQIERRRLVEWFKKECELICTNEDELCNIVLDICYKTENSKQFAWDVCGDIFIRNLLRKNNYTLSFPELSRDWHFKYMGYGFTMKAITISEDDIV